MSAGLGAIESPWLRLVSRWALLQGLYGVGLLLFVGLVLGFDSFAPDRQLVAASRSPAAFRVYAALDALSWLGIAGC
jgi:hypothetical protein